MANRPPTSELDIRNAMIEYVLANHVSSYDHKSMPLDQSLVELGVLDSYGVVELVSFIESNWSTTIEDAEITKEKMGSINRMVSLVQEKISSETND
ncbi:MAG: acyl carrier protein [Rhodospirillales bacterium]|nr:acyl carrier protein [Rhodospirillales bacterium]